MNTSLYCIAVCVCSRNSGRVYKDLFSSWLEIQLIFAFTHVFLSTADKVKCKAGSVFPVYLENDRVTQH